jgi:hypothetical protein
MHRFAKIITLSLLYCIGADAATLIASPDNFGTIMAAARPGDSVTVAGNFGGVTIIDRDFGAAGLRINAWGATFTGTFGLRNVIGLTLRGGKFSVPPTSTTARAIGITGSHRISIEYPAISGSGSAYGIIAQASSEITVSNGRFRALRLGLGFIDISGGRIADNGFIAMSSDGINVAGSSSRITLIGNSCAGTAISPGAHPDCIQMWSVAGKPQLADITITKTSVSGATQGITLFDLGGQRIIIADNRVNTSYPQGIACYLCDDSRITGNVVTTEPGARWRTSINASGTNLVVEGNSVGPLNR